MGESRGSRRKAASGIRRVLHVVLAVVVLAVPAVVATGQRKASANDHFRALGVYEGPGSPARVREFESWLGREVSWVLDYLPDGSWGEIESPAWSVGQWQGSGHRVVYSVPIIPRTGGTLTDGANGRYNQHFIRLAQLLVAKGQSDAVLRLGWEFNGDWYRWSAARNPEAFAEYWRQIVRSMRAVSGARFRFDWAPNPGPSSFSLSRAYPGDSYVDYIGLSFYDQGWADGWWDPVRRWQHAMDQPNGLRWHRDFAAAHGKPMTYPEWGLLIRNDGHGGGDNPYYIERMYEWVNSNNVAYFLYFDYPSGTGDHLLRGGGFPQGAQKFRQLFGSTQAVSGNVVARHSGKVLDVSAASSGNGAKIIQWDWTGSDHQRFALEPLGDGYHRIRAKHSGKVLDVSGASTANGAAVIQWDWTGSRHQRFRF